MKSVVFIEFPTAVGRYSDLQSLHFVSVRRRHRWIER